MERNSSMRAYLFDLFDQEIYFSYRNSTNYNLEKNVFMCAFWFSPFDQEMSFSD